MHCPFCGANKDQLKVIDSRSAEGGDAIRRRREFERYAGWPVSMKLHHAFENRGKRLEGELCGISGPDDDEIVRLKLDDGTEINVPRAEIARANGIAVYTPNATRRVRLRAALDARNLPAGCFQGGGRVGEAPDVRLVRVHDRRRAGGVIAEVSHR